ncbi:MAG: phosphatase domain-containing protein [Erythrobacter sp.]
MASGSSQIRVQPFTGYRNADRLRISARVLRGSPPDFTPHGLLGTIRTMAALYASREVANIPVELSLAGKVAGQSISDEEGFVHFDVPSASPLPTRLAWDTASLHWDSHGQANQIDGRVLTPAHNAQIGIISDIDDTILETGITGSAKAILRNAHRIFAQLPQDRKTVPGAAEFFESLTKSGKADERACFYVSSSPWNLYPYLRAYKELRELPSGPLMLRDWGLSRATLGSNSHGTHKTAAILQLLSDFPQKRFVLIGDDTQRDLAAFAGIVEAQPKRIAAVFVRRAAKLGSIDEDYARTVMDAHTMPFWMGEDFAGAHALLAQTELA